jgi:hypothetical protein
LVSDQTLTDKQFIEKSDRLLREALADIGDGRALLVPRTYTTPEDLNNGFSYHCEVSMGTNNARTVGTFTPVVMSRGDLLAAIGGNA